MNTVSTHPVHRLLRRSRLHILGVNSGTSMDGLDLALIAVTEDRGIASVRCLATSQRPYPTKLRQLLYHLAVARKVDKAVVARAHVALGEFIASAAHAVQGRRVDLIASHGQTIGHFPGRGSGALSRFRATWQLGAPSVIACLTGIVTVGDFRTADVAAGGMGAPLSGYYHHILFGGVPVLNIGGIANVSVSRERSPRLEVLAFDTGPGNMLLDLLAQRLLGKNYDRDGRVAAAGRPVDAVVDRALREKYFHRPPTKTCGREEFGGAAWMRWWPHRSRCRPTSADALATALEITVRSIAFSIDRWVAPVTRARRLVISGGGADNATLVRRLAELLPQWQLIRPEVWGIPSRFVEPVGFAVLAHETLRGRPGNLGGATGARQPAVLGTIALPAGRHGRTTSL